MKKISCIIPAYNEAESIKNTLSVVTPLIGSDLHEVIVVDDASYDNTRLRAKAFPRVRVIEHRRNRGKSRTVADGIKAATGDYVFLLDADLRNLNEQNIIDLIEPIKKNIADVTLSYRKNIWPFPLFKKIDCLTGERILSKAALLPSLEVMAKLPSYGLEVFLNRIIIREHMRLSVVKWPNVMNTFNQSKRGLLKGMWVIVRIWLNVLSTISPLEMYSQNLKMKKLLVRPS